MFSIVKDQEFWVQVPQSISPNKQPTDPGIAMEVGLEGIVLLSIKYDQMFHEIGHGCIMGKLRFYLVNVKIDKAEVSLIKKETTWPQGEQELTQQETLKKFEIIDGTPAKDEVVPVRIYFSSIEPWKVTPTIPDDAPVEHRFSVKYFIHLALCDTKGRRFFKQRELILWRKNL
jgi:vacuolar protein sorting-associated protein 26